MKKKGSKQQQKEHTFIKIFKYLKHHLYLIASLLLIVCIYIYLYNSLGRNIFYHSNWDSYTIQAQAWITGTASLKENYSWLELATFKGRIFVSFPPVPSLVMLTLIPFFDGLTPNAVATSIYVFISFIVLYKLGRRFNLSDFTAAFWSFFGVIGTNLLSISVDGGVWFQAQTLSFMLLCLSIYFVMSKTTTHWYFATITWALAIGCRPLQLIFFPVLTYLLIQNIKTIFNDRRIYRFLLYVLPALIIGLVYAAYNYIRFESMTEFGHNYLPEFLNAHDGQFSLNYISQNWRNIFRLPSINNNFKPEFERFDGFAFYIANPIFISFIFRFIYLIYKLKRINFFDLMIFSYFVAYVLALLSHKTLGGWQFGIRYFLDVIPVILFYIIYRQPKVFKFEIPIMLFAVGLNIYGTLWLFLNW